MASGTISDGLIGQFPPQRVWRVFALRQTAAFSQALLKRGPEVVGLLRHASREVLA